MPTYSYRCYSCGKVTDVVRGIDDRDRAIACECGNGWSYKVVTPVPTTFKFADNSPQKKTRK